MTVAIIATYLGAVLLVGLGGHRLLRGTGEDYFLATRSIGPFVLLMSLFGTHMTSFSLLGASGEAYRSGIGVFSLMASSSALVVPLVFYFCGVRLWRLGKRHGYVTQVEFFRDRWRSPLLGTLLFALLVLLLIPYLLIGVMGGGLALAQISDGLIPEWAGSLAVSLVVLVYVTAGGLRSTAWANTFQTLIFMTLGGVTFAWILNEVGGLTAALDRVAAAQPQRLVREGTIPPLKLVTYAFIPLSVGMFPHIFMHWLTARRAEAFRLSMVGYPLCIAIVWVPSVLLGVIGTTEIPGLEGPAANSVLVQMIKLHAPGALAGLLGAGVFAAIMSSLDSQVLSLGTMFTKDIVGRQRSLPPETEVKIGRAFIVLILGATFVISLFASKNIFSLGVWSFTGFAGLFPLVLGALYWRRSTATGAIAAVVAAAGTWLWFFTQTRSIPGYTVGGTGVMPVAVVFAASAVALVIGSLVSSPPDAAWVDRFIPARRSGSSS